MRLRRFLLLSLAVAVGFAVGGATFQFSMSQRPMQIEVSGITETSFADFKAKHEIAALPWISPSEAVAHCNLKTFKVRFGSENIETVSIPLNDETAKAVDCIFELATYPSKHSLSFKITQG